MGYTTDFWGSFAITPPLKPDDATFLRRFSETRRMGRPNAPVDQYGEDGEWYIDDEGEGEKAWQAAAWMNADDSEAQRQVWYVPDANRPPAPQPGLWCQWIPNHDGTELEWDGGEKFYEYDTWLVYLIERYFKPRGYVLNGSVEWQGEDRDDLGLLSVEDNVVSVLRGRREFGDAERLN